MAAAMNEIRARLRAALWWLVPLLLALALLAWETDLGRAIRRLPPPEDAIPARPVVASLLPEYAIAGGTAARTETVQRTLFNPTRRPAPVLVGDATKSRMQKGQFALTGTMVIGGKNTAFLKETAGGKSRRVLQGETVNGILVAEVKSDRVRLALGDESEELVLRVATNPRPTVQLPNAQPVAPTPGGAPAVPPTAASGGMPAPLAGTADASLAERRRAARAAQAAVQAQTSTPDGNPLPNPPPVQAPAATPPPAPVAPAAAAAPAPGNAPDPRWADMYRAYQQPRTPNVPR